MSPRLCALLHIPPPPPSVGVVPSPSSAFPQCPAEGSARTETSATPAAALPEQSRARGDQQRGRPGSQASPTAEGPAGLGRGRRRGGGAESLGTQTRSQPPSQGGDTQQQGCTAEGGASPRDPGGGGGGSWATENRDLEEGVRTPGPGGRGPEGHTPGRALSPAWRESLRLHTRFQVPFTRWPHSPVEGPLPWTCSRRPTRTPWPECPPLPR